jgi:hypothetical protein
MRASIWLLIGVLFMFGCSKDLTAPMERATIQGKVMLGSWNDSLIAGSTVVYFSFPISPPIDSVKSDAQGRYVLNVAPGKYRLNAFNPITHLPGITSDTVIAVAGKIDTVDLFLELYAK